MLGRVFIGLNVLVAHAVADADEVCKSDNCKHVFGAQELLQLQSVSIKSGMHIGDASNDVDGESSNNTNTLHAEVQWVTLYEKKNLKCDGRILGPTKKDSDVASCKAACIAQGDCKVMVLVDNGNKNCLLYASCDTFITAKYPCSAQKIQAPWFCVAKANKNAVVGPYATLDAAKSELNKAQGSYSNQQMICEMTNSGAKGDPHYVGGENQGGDAAHGFNKYWNDWAAINKMNKMCTDKAACAAGVQAR